jgi:hypothetical protein
MDAFVSRRLGDGRYRLNISSRNQPSTAVTSWYESSDFAALSGGGRGASATSVVLASDAPTRHVAAAEKKAYSEAKKRALEDRDTSDGSDAGICWSDNERVPGTAAGTKGSCRPKKKKKDEKKDGEASPKKESKD